MSRSLACESWCVHAVATVQVGSNQAMNHFNAQTGTFERSSGVPRSARVLRFETPDRTTKSVQGLSLPLVVLFASAGQIARSGDSAILLFAVPAFVVALGFAGLVFLLGRD